MLPLRCPCEKKAKLQHTEAGFVCQQPGCVHGQAKNSFRVVDGTPILISDRLCDTVCDAAKIRPWIPKRSSLFRGLQKLAYGESKTTRTNCREFIRHLKGMAKTPTVLVIGAGERGSATDALWNDSAIEIHGVDVYLTPTVDAVCDGHYLPLASGHYHGVWIQAVLEHVVNPPEVVAEIHRVLRAGGIVYAETPFMQQVHSGAYDFTRFTVLGHRYLFRQFRLLAMGGHRGAEVVLAWSIRYFIWAITRSRTLARIAIGFEVLLRPFGFLVSKKSMYDAASGSYFMGTKSTKTEVTHKQLIALYKGQM